MAIVDRTNQTWIFRWFIVETQNFASLRQRPYIILRLEKTIRFRFCQRLFSYFCPPYFKDSFNQIKPCHE